MATSGYEEYVTAVSLNAAADLSVTGINRFVKVENDDGEGKINLAGAAERCVGVLLNKPEADSPGRVGIAGIVPILLGGNVTAGGEVSSGANGVGVAQASTNPSYGVALSSGVSGDIIPLLLLPQR